MEEIKHPKYKKGDMIRYCSSDANPNDISIILGFKTEKEEDVNLGFGYYLTYDFINRERSYWRIFFVDSSAFELMEAT
jgi:hypothetical protein